jgi:3-deoxy-manno-octulosonate cytidylyltransferase (CMP-KDO synthetase)
MNDTICIIPARMASSRFPGKPLATIVGLPMILHVLERCRRADGLGRVVVATCDREIFDAVKAYGGEAVMTADTHPGCVDRTEEAIEILAPGISPDALVLMVQGDEILVTPEMVTRVVSRYRDRPAPVVNLASRIAATDDHDDPNRVKVVCAPDGRALCFSRAPIPSRFRSDDVPMYQQTGVIGFSAGFLKTFGQLARTPLEMAEQIDMMRTLEHGFEVQMIFTDDVTFGVDTPADLARAESVLADDPITQGYLATAND